MNRTNRLRLACGQDPWALDVQHPDGSDDATGLYRHAMDCPQCGVYLQACTIHLAEFDPQPPKRRDAVEQQYFSVKETAVFLGVSPKTVRRRIREGAFPHYRLWDGSTLRIRRSDLDELLKRARIEK